jgi:hypothetical protein
MPQLSIRFVQGSSTPSVLIDGSFGGPLVREFVENELRPASSCEYFLKTFEALPAGSEYDHGFGNAIAVYAKDGIAHLEHVISDIPEYKLPLAQLLAIARVWANALSSTASDFEPQEFEVPA